MAKMSTKTNRQIFIWCFLLNLILLCLFAILFYGKLETQNDVLMKSLVDGFADEGHSVSKLLFSNVILGKCLELFHTMVPGVSWYVIMHYILVFLALCIISYIVISRNNSKTGLLIVIAVNLFLGFECYMLVNYLKTTALLTSASFMWLLFILEEKKGFLSVGLWLFTYVAGSMISFQMCVICTLVWIALIVGYLIRLGHLKKCWIRALFLTVTGLSLAGTAYLTDEYVYIDNNDTLYASIFRREAEKNIVYGFAEYDEEWGYENDVDNISTYNMLASGYYMNENSETYVGIKKIAERSRSFNYDNIMLFFRRVPIGYLGCGFFFAVIMLWILHFYFKLEYKGFFLGLSSFCILTISFPLFMKYGFNYRWIYLCLCIPFICFNAFLLKDAKSDENRYLAVCFMLLTFVLYNRFNNVIPTMPADDKYEGYVDDLNDNSDYIINARYYMSRFSMWSIYDTNCIGKKDNIYVADGIYGLISGKAREFSSYEYDPRDTKSLTWIYKGMNADNPLLIFGITE